MLRLTASGLLNGKLSTFLVKAHIEQCFEVGSHIGGDVQVVDSGVK